MEDVCSDRSQVQPALQGNSQDDAVSANVDQMIINIRDRLNLNMANDQSKSPPPSPKSSSSSLGAYSFFLGYYFFLGSSFLVSLAAGAFSSLPLLACPPVGAPPILAAPSAMSWWMLFPLRLAMTRLMSSSLMEACTPPNTPLISLAAK